ncbi:hypothetical protein RvY_03706 [Ramazzottius varieornatus]|uniref:Uncharacterized protein n=1 Tax=Ramazzottius varieornatus TaxID=947166 RepID=A0A1D1UZ66_RAMVA|nr:hypothetical protein RvY_03706 [Ramazzottius varieornatus]
MPKKLEAIWLSTILRQRPAKTFVDENVRDCLATEDSNTQGRKIRLKTWEISKVGIALGEGASVRGTGRA